MTTTPWYANTDNVQSLAEWLHEQGAFADIPAVLRFYEKPWNWGEEWDKFEDSQEVEEAAVQLTFSDISPEFEAVTGIRPAVR